MAWAERAVRVPVHDHWWQTETGCCIAGLRGVGPHARRRISAMPGFDLRCLDADGRGQVADQPGELVLRLPLPPGCLAGLWRDPGRMQALYLDTYPGFFRTFDYGRIDAAGDVTLLSHVDDVIKVAGRLVATGTIEDVLAAHPDVAECGVAACDDALRGQRPIAYVVPKNGLDAARLETLRYDLIRSVQEAAGTFRGLRQVVFRAALPRTHSDRTLRRTLAGNVVHRRDDAIPQQGARFWPCAYEWI